MQASLYIHWPFCEKKCPYCDFNSHERDNINYQDWENAYLNELDFYSEILIPNLKISSIFFGGGTPSLMNPKTIENIINKIAKKFRLTNNAEITLEANPSSSEAEKFNNFKNAGINRISIGVQSFNEENLKFLGRKHDKNQAIKAIEMAQNIFANYSFDLIYALPNQTINDWQNELNFALKFSPPHLSLYQLTIEKGTDFFGRYKRKEFLLPPTDLQDEMYNSTIRKAFKNGLKQYEISNFAERGFESKHNMNYWQYGDYIGVGAGAHGRISNKNIINFSNLQKFSKDKLENNNLKISTLNIHSPENWLNNVKINKSGLQAVKQMNISEIIEEKTYMGLRIKKGFYKKDFFQFANKNFEEYFSAALVKNLIEAKYLRISQNKISPTKTGMKLHRALIHKLFKN